MLISITVAVDSIRAWMPCSLLSASMIPFATGALGIGATSWVTSKHIFQVNSSFQFFFVLLELGKSKATEKLTHLCLSWGISFKFSILKLWNWWMNYGRNFEDIYTYNFWNLNNSLKINEKIKDFFIYIFLKASFKISRSWTTRCTAPICVFVCSSSRISPRRSSNCMATSRFWSPRRRTSSFCRIIKLTVNF